MRQRRKSRAQQSPTHDVAPRLAAAGLGNAALAERLQARLQTEPDRARALGTKGPARPLPYRERLAASLGGAEVDGVRFYGGTPEAAWATASLGTVAFAHDGAIVAASATPPVDVVAHELAHILQGAGGAAGGVAATGSPAEREAGAVADAAARGQAVSVEQAAPAGAVHRFPGAGMLPVDVPIPGLVSDLVEAVVDELVEQAVEAVVAGAEAAVAPVRDAVYDAVAGMGAGFEAVAEGAAETVDDLLDERPNEDVLDFQEDAASGWSGVDADAASGLAEIIRARRAGDDVPVRRIELVRGQLEALDSEGFRLLIAALDEAGLLMAVTRAVLGGTPAAGETGVFEVPVVTWEFWNAAADVTADVRVANQLFEPHGIHIRSVGGHEVSKAQVEAIVGHKVPQELGVDCSASEYSGDFTDDDFISVVEALGVGQIISALWVPTIVDEYGDGLAGVSTQNESNDLDANVAVVATKGAGEDTFAHELGHILTRGGHFKGDEHNLMARGDRRDKKALGPDRLTATQVANMRDDILGYLRS